MGSAACRASRSAAGACSASSSSVAEASELPPERLAEPLEALEAGAPPELVRLGLWVGRRVLLDARARARAGAASGHRRRDGRSSPRATADRASRRAHRRGDARRSSGGSRLGVAPARRARGAARRPIARPRASPGSRRPSWRRRPAPIAPRCAGSSAAASSRLVEREARRRPSVPRVGDLRSGVDVDPAPAPSRRGDRGGARLAGGRRGACCCTASPGRARPRSTSPRPRRHWRAGAASIVLVPEIAPDAADRDAVPRPARRHAWRCCTPSSAPASATTSGGDCAAARRGSASARARPCSRRSATSGCSSSTRSTTPATSRRATRATTRATSRGIAPSRRARCWSPGPRRRAPRAWLAFERLELPARVDGRRLPRGRGAGHARRRPASGPLHPRTRSALDELARRGRQGDRAAQPPRLVRCTCRAARAAMSGAAPTATSPWSCIGAVDRLAATTAGAPSGSPTRARECGSVTLARAGAGTEQVEALLADVPRRAARLPARLRQRRRHRSPISRSSSGFQRGAGGRPARHADGRQGPRLRRRLAERRPRRRRDAALPRLPRRGAHLRARLAARRAAAAGARPAAACSSRRWRRTPPRSAHAARHDSEGFLAAELERRRALAIRRSRTWSGSSSRAPTPARCRPTRAGSQTRWRARCRRPPSCSARRRACGCADAIAASCCSRAATGPRSSAAVRATIEGLAADRALGASALSVDVDPQ